MSRSNDKGRPAQRRRSASFGARLIGWVNMVVPWFAVGVLVLLAVWLLFPLYWAIQRLFHAGGMAGDRWTTVAVFAGALVGTVSLGLVAVRAVSPARKWPADAQVRVLATVGLLLVAVTAPLLVLRGELVPVIALVIYYVRIRRTLTDILPAWCGGTWKPENKRRGPRGEEVVKRPPRSWDETSGPGPGAADARRAGGRGRKKQAKKKRRSGR